MRRDKRVLALVKAFCKAGIFTELGEQEATDAGTPQGGILSPLLANIALSVLDGWFMEEHHARMGSVWAREKRRRQGLPTWRLVRYADDWVALVHGNRADAEELRMQAAVVLAPMGLRLSEAKTSVTHIDQGFVFLGHHIRRRRKRGTSKRYVYTYPSKKALASAIGKVRALTHPGQPDLRVLLLRVNAVLRGWCNYFRHGSSKRTYSYVGDYTWHRMARWLRKLHGGMSWKKMLRRIMVDGWAIAADGIELFNAPSTPVTRYRWRGWKIPTPWAPRTVTKPAAA